MIAGPEVLQRAGSAVTDRMAAADPSAGTTFASAAPPLDTRAVIDRVQQRGYVDILEIEQAAGGFAVVVRDSDGRPKTIYVKAATSRPADRPPGRDDPDPDVVQTKHAR